MRHKLSLALLPLTLTPALASADSAKPIEISPLVVVGSDKADYEELHLAGAVDSVSRDEIENAHVDNNMELFTKLPGVNISSYNQGVFDSEVGIRGFASDGPSPHAKLLIDGIPANMNGGHQDMDQLFSGNIESINVYKGTSDPRYGLFNLAGSYNVATRSDLDRSIQATVGSFGSEEVQAYLGEQTGNLTHSYFFGYRNSDGYRDHDHVEKQSLSGRWFYDLNDATTLGLIARATRFDTDAPGFLTEEQARENPEMSAAHSSEDGGHKNTDTLSLHLDHDFSDSVNWSLKSYYNHFDRQRWVRFLEIWPLQERIYDEKHKGITSDLTWNFAEDWSLLWGVNYEDQNVTEQRFSTVDNKRVRNSVIWDYQYDYVTYGTYLQINNTPVHWLEWNAALRADRLDGDFTNTDGSKKEMYDFGTIMQPKFNLFVYPTDDVMLFANYGRTFQPVFSSSAYTDGDRNARDISINDGWEVGAKWHPTSTLQLRLSTWEQRARDEFVLVNGVEQNVGKTLRQGVDVGANWLATQDLTLWANYSATKTEIQTQGSNQGNELRSVPDYTASLGMTYELLPDLTWRLHYDIQGAYYINEANAGGKYGEYELVNTNLQYDTSWGSIDLQVNNLFDEYYEYAFDFTNDGSGTRIFSPGDGINATLSATYHF